MLKLVERDDETTETQLQQILQQNGYTVSLQTILRHRSTLLLDLLPIN